MRCFLILSVVFSAVFGEEEKVFKVAGTDSYLEAYKVSHGDSVNDLLDNAVKKSDREYIEPGGYPYSNSQPQYGGSFGSSGPSAPNYNNYGPPSPQYNPGAAYGPPNPGPVYGPPNPGPVYGPPNPPPVYGPPAPAPMYGPPSSVQVFYGVPHAMLSIWDKLKLKLDLFTVGKILLKLVIFKKIVSLIAILCLLLFIPSLKHKVESSEADGEEMMRHLNNNDISGPPRSCSSPGRRIYLLSLYGNMFFANFTRVDVARERLNRLQERNPNGLQFIDHILSNSDITFDLFKVLSAQTGKIT
ncbi:hypothetical protein NQ314_015587, partial [Rhamnusium bicolor]